MFPSSVTIWSMLFTPCVRRAYPNTLHAHTLQRDAHWSRVVRDALMSFTISDSLSDSHIPSLHHCSIVIPLCEGRSIRSCVTELLSDIRAVQMDDPTTSPWPPDKKPSLFVQPSPLLLLFLSYPSLKAQLQLFVTSLKKKVFPRIPCRAISYSLFRAFPKEQEALWCRHISSVPLLCRFSLFLDNRFLPKALRLVESWSHVPAVCLSVCVCVRETETNVKHCCCKLSLSWKCEFFHFPAWVIMFPGPLWEHGGLHVHHWDVPYHTHPKCKFSWQLSKSMSDNRTIWQSAGLFELIAAYLSN